MGIVDMSLWNVAQGTTAPEFSEVKNRVDQSFNLFTQVTQPMRHQAMLDDPMRGSFQKVVSDWSSIGGGMLGGWMGGGIANMFSSPAVGQMSSVAASPGYFGTGGSNIATSFWNRPGVQGYIQGAQQSQLPQQMSQVASGMLF